MARNRTYYDGDLRRDIMDAALHVIAEAGPSAISLRSLARDLGVSHAAPANHFSDRGALLTAVAAEGLDLLDGAQADAIDALPPDATAAAVVRAIAAAHLRTVKAHPAHAVLMWDPAVPDPDGRVLQARAAAIAALTTAVHHAVAPDQAAARSAMVWALVHGIITAVCDGTLPVSAGEPVDVVLDAALTALMSTGPADARGAGARCAEAWC